MLATGLMAGGSDRVRTLRRTGRLGVAGVALTALVAAGGVTLTNTVLAQDDVSPEGLVDALVELEQAIPTPLPPAEVIIDQVVVGGAPVAEGETWAEFIGDFTGAKIALDAVVEEARQLFIAADEADGEVADAVAEIAYSYVLLQNAFTYLAAWQSTDLTFPLETFDEFDTATGADSGLAYAEAGFRVEIEAFEQMLPAYDVLRRAEVADAEERALFDTRYQVVEVHHAVLLPNLHRALSLDTRQVIWTIDRFATQAPGVEARARIMRITCVDRDAYPVVRDAPPEAEAEVAALLTDQITTVDCPDLDNGNEVRPLGPIVVP